jgi:aryl-alcohol dehydrogenase-like predicted oxidoreductase
MTTTLSVRSMFPGASRLGMGCASLGSRVGARQGLAALDDAFASGVNWFDLAPSYGDGQCEPIFASFAKSRRSRIFICTKAGIAAGPVSPVQALIKPAARMAIRAVPQLRQIIARGRASAEPVAITGPEITASLDRSLQRLSTSYVDVFALHDPRIDDLTHEDVARALEDAVTSGKARAAGIAGTVQAALAARRAGLPIRHVQFEATPPGTAAHESGSYFADTLTVTHSVSAMALPQALKPLADSRSRDPDPRLVRYGYSQAPSAALQLAKLDYALARNRDGIVLVSMFDKAHRAANIARMAGAQSADPLALFDKAAHSEFQS